MDQAQVADVGGLDLWDEEVLASFEKKRDDLMREGFLLFIL
jgi:hypothetical protein